MKLAEAHGCKVLAWLRMSLHTVVVIKGKVLASFYGVALVTSHAILALAKLVVTTVVGCHLARACGVPAVVVRA